MSTPPFAGAAVFGVGVVDGTELTLSDTEIQIPGLECSISLEVPNPYDDML